MKKKVKLGCRICSRRGSLSVGYSNDSTFGFLNQNLSFLKILESFFQVATNLTHFMVHACLIASHALHLTPLLVFFCIFTFYKVSCEQSQVL